ncbi:unnamed protein product [Cylindrotheca closterium]|uniref:Menin n=1 Tax=Cylindrotheca closterium TaxID=2856 RepID=A0AAD2FNY3_9STRA|nr:unnamed protein product [Cylindrotheca closterium]
MAKNNDQRPRVTFDDGDDCAENDGPQNSAHWQSLNHKEVTDQVLHNMNDLISCFRKESAHPTKTTLAVWSCVAGYCEALATHKEKRYSIFPIPIDAIRRLVQEEFQQFLSALQIDSSDKSSHRETVRTISNAIWAKARPKPNVRDEPHANSVYVCLRGDIDKKSLDCFGACLATIAGLRILGIEYSYLCLSEDHAYERHQLDPDDVTSIGTCEVAIPGRTNRDKAKRGKDIASTFEDTKDTKPYLTPETSWLYMASNPVVCDTDAMALVAVIGNINCTIEESGRKGYFFESGGLYAMKREMLWVLYDQGHMKKFPFGLMELGNCEENRGSPRSEEWVQVEGIAEPILVNEQLFHDAIQVSRNVYHDAQVYPYYYAGHYHKDAGKTLSDQESRLVESLKMYAQAARVTSMYPYELQLNKHLTKIAMLIMDDILTSTLFDDDEGVQDANDINKKNKNKPEPRKWLEPSNAIHSCMWLLNFFDSLLFWEESQQVKEQEYRRQKSQGSGSSRGRGRSGGGGSSVNQQFVEILVPSHPHSISKLMACFDKQIRHQALTKLQKQPSTSSMPTKTETTTNEGPYQLILRSKRLQAGSLLCKGIMKPKVTIREMDLAIILEDDNTGQDDSNGGGGGRRSKRARRG